MIGMVMMGLGVFRFGAASESFQQLQQSSAYRWAAVDRVGRAPAQQYLGPGAETITLSGTIYPSFRGGLRQIELMRAQAGRGRPMMLVGGLGWVFDRWVITQVNDTRSYFLSDGAPRQIDFDLTLTRYGTDR